MLVLGLYGTTGSIGKSTTLRSLIGYSRESPVCNVLCLCTLNEV